MAFPVCSIYAVTIRVNDMKVYVLALTQFFKKSCYVYEIMALIFFLIMGLTALFFLLVRSTDIS